MPHRNRRSEAAITRMGCTVESCGRVEQDCGWTVGGLMDRLFLAAVFVGIIVLVGALAFAPL